MVRFGIVGAGDIAKKFSRDIKFVNNAKITAIASRSLDKAKNYQEKYHIDYAFGSYEAMAKSDMIDAAYIATPHNFHYEHALLFIKNKKHVMIEKPITVNLKQYEALICAAKENKVLMMEAMWTYFLPSIIYIKKLVDSGDMGKLKEAKINFGFPIAFMYSKDKRLLNPNLAGGSLLDLGVYPLAFYNLIKKQPTKSIKATAKFTRTGVDASCYVDITEENGAQIHIKSSIYRFLKDHAILKFENGKIIMKDFHKCQKMYINGKKKIIPYEGEGFVHEIRAFAADIEKGLLEDPIMSCQVSRESMRLLDEIRGLINLKYPFEENNS